jgi:hypothetical protein
MAQMFMTRTFLPLNTTSILKQINTRERVFWNLTTIRALLDSDAFKEDPDKGQFTVLKISLLNKLKTIPYETVFQPNN